MSRKSHQKSNIGSSGCFDWRGFDLVWKQLAMAREDAKGMFLGGPEHCPIESVLDSYTRLESPIEAVFLIWFEFLCLYAGQVGSHAFMLRAQRTVECDGERFRPDFIVVPCEPILASFGELLGCPMKIAVELDGHDFHERTKEQVIIRNRRDRILQHNGWTILHISGSELVRPPQVEALKEIWQTSTEQLERIRTAIAKDWGISLKYESAEHTADNQVGVLTSQES